MARLTYNNQGGYLGSSGLTSSGTTITFGVAPNFATISGGDTIPLVLDAGSANFEVVYLTAYTSGATTGTIARAAEDATLWPAVAHAATTGTWMCAPTIKDGQYPYNTPAARMYFTTNSGALGAGTYDVVPCTQDFAVGGMTCTSLSGNPIITVPVAGKYLVCASINGVAAAALNLGLLVYINGSQARVVSNAPAGYWLGSVAWSGVINLAAAATVSWYFSVSGSTYTLYGGAGAGTELSVALVSAP